MPDVPPHPPAWLPDPNRPGRLRYWNGDEWTEHFAPAPNEPAPSLNLSQLPPPAQVPVAAHMQAGAKPGGFWARRTKTQKGVAIAGCFFVAFMALAGVAAALQSKKSPAGAGHSDVWKDGYSAGLQDKERDDPTGCSGVLAYEYYGDPNITDDELADFKDGCYQAFADD